MSVAAGTFPCITGTVTIANVYPHNLKKRGIMIILLHQDYCAVFR